MEVPPSKMNSPKPMKILTQYLAKILIIAAVLLSSCELKDKDSLSKLADQIHAVTSNHHNKGLFDGTILVADLSGVIYQNAFGLADREKNIPLTPESQFYLASVSKQFTAAAILLLVQQGKIILDERITQYIPELPEFYKDITFRHLLNHTSGIPDYYEFMEPFDGFTNEDVLEVLINLDSLEFKPATKYTYSNSGYVLLSILVKRISGSSFANFLKNNAFDRIGLKHTIIFDPYAHKPEKRAIGYGKDGTLTDYRFRTTGGGGIFSTVTDLYLWHKGLSTNLILKDDFMDLAYQPAVLNNDSIVFYGFGWFIDPEDNQHVYHDGDLEGFRTLFDRRLDNGKVIILLSNNSSAALDKIAKKIWKLW
jgi:CubicO group peptidase (beta-lactamase class C family)